MKLPVSDFIDLVWVFLQHLVTYGHFRTSRYQDYNLTIINQLLLLDQEVSNKNWHTGTSSGKNYSSLGVVVVSPLAACGQLRTCLSNHSERLLSAVKVKNMWYNLSVCYFSLCYCWYIRQLRRSYNKQGLGLEIRVRAKWIPGVQRNEKCSHCMYFVFPFLLWTTCQQISFWLSHSIFHVEQFAVMILEN